jgi:hypothetical protein
MSTTSFFTIFRPFLAIRNSHFPSRFQPLPEHSCSSDDGSRTICFSSLPMDFGADSLIDWHWFVAHRGINVLLVCFETVAIGDWNEPRATFVAANQESVPGTLSRQSRSSFQTEIATLYSSIMSFAMLKKFRVPACRNRDLNPKSIRRALGQSLCKQIR